MIHESCIWCGTGDGQAKAGRFWIHAECFDRLSDFRQDIKSVRMRLERGEQTPEIVAFLNRMKDFDERSAKTMKIIEEYAG